MKKLTVECVNKSAGHVSRSSGFRVQMLALVAITLALLPCISPAATYTWDGSDNGNWGTGNNWTPVKSGGPSGGDTACFDGTGINLNTINSTRNLQTISITASQTVTVVINTKTNAYISFNVSGNHISVEAGDHKVVGNGTGSSGTFFDIGFPSSSTNNISSGASFEIQGRIKGGGSDFTKIGGGTLILSGHNGNSGGWQPPLVRIQDGALRLAATGASGNSGNNFIVSSGAALEVSGNSTHTVGTGTWSLNGIGISGHGALLSVSGDNELKPSGSGTIALNSASSIGVDSGTLTVKRVISGANTLTKVGAGTLLLSTTNTYTGATIVQAGTLAFGTTNVLSASSSVSLAGGTLAMNTYSNALSTLTLGGDAEIDLGDGTGSLSFANSSALSWTGTLSLTGTLGEKTLRFGQNAGALTPEQQAMIKANGYSVRLDNEGYVVILRGTVLMLF